jgi:hypothetical protein
MARDFQWQFQWLTMTAGIHWKILFFPTGVTVPTGNRYYTPLDTYSNGIFTVATPFIQREPPLSGYPIGKRLTMK